MSINKYLDKIISLNLIEIIPVDERIWIESLLLEWSNRDPADRVIVATAMINDLPLLSKDEKIRQFYQKTIW